MRKSFPPKGVKVLNKDYFNEFVIEVGDSISVLEKLKNNGILGGFAIGEKRILVSATEMNTADEILRYADCI